MNSQLTFNHFRYVCWAGLVFVPLTVPYMEKLGGDENWEDEAPKRLTKYVFDEKRKFPDQQIVVLARVLVDEVNFGYEEESTALTSVNDIPIRNLAHLLKIIDESKTGFIKFVLDSDTVMVFDVEEANSRSAHILKTHKIPTRTNLGLQKP